MKISEVKQTNEMKLGDLIGDWGAAQLSGTAGATTQQKMEQNIFIKNMVGDALSNLDTAIKGGLVDPQAHLPPGYRKGYGLGKNIRGFFRGYKHGHQDAGQAGATSTAPASTTPAQAPQGNLNVTYKGNPVSNSPTNLMTAPKTQQAPSTAPKAAQPAAPTAAPTKQPRQTVAQKIQPQLQQQANRFAAGKRNQPMRESENLNEIFEAIVNQDYLNEKENKVMTISDYLTTQWLPGYLKGVDYSAAQDQIDKLIDQVEQTYMKDKGKAALTQLAQVAFAASANKLGGAVGKGAAKPVAGDQTNQISDRPAATGTKAPGTTQPAAGTTASSTPSATTTGGGGAGQVNQSLAMPLSKVLDILQASIKNSRDRKVVIDYLQGRGMGTTKPKKSVPNTAPAPSKTAQQPITVGDEKIKPSDPRYTEIMKGAQSNKTVVDPDYFKGGMDKPTAAGLLESKNVRRTVKKPTK